MHVQLCDAAACGDVAGVRCLVERQTRKHVNERDRVSNVKAVSNWVDVDERLCVWQHQYGAYPLTLAAWGGHLGVVEYLVEVDPLEPMWRPRTK